MGERPSRPIGFVGDEPLIRRIDDRELYIGNARATDPEAHERSFDAVVTLSSEPGGLTTHHHPLPDGPRIEWGPFAAAVDMTRRLYRRDGPVLVSCRAAVSRSATVLATVVGAEENRTFRAALEIVQETRPIATPHPALHAMGVVYLAAEGVPPREAVESPG